MSYKIKTKEGESIYILIERAKKLAVEKNQTVEFEYTGMICYVNNDTDVDEFYAHYYDSMIMGWETIGQNRSEL